MSLINSLFALLKLIDGVHYALFDEESERLAVWYGGHTINIYYIGDFDFDTPIDAISLGYSSDLTRHDAHVAIACYFAKEPE